MTSGIENDIDCTDYYNAIPHPSKDISWELIKAATDDKIAAAWLNYFRDVIDRANEAKGWRDNYHALMKLAENDPDLKKIVKNYVVGTNIALIHSELSEALEGLRKDKMDDHLPHRQAIEVEFADAIIRILDLAGTLKLDIGGAVLEKHNYNQERADHKKENRAKNGGKKF